MLGFEPLLTILLAMHGQSRGLCRRGDMIAKRLVMDESGTTHPDRGTHRS
jgi:hypothetical protein